MKSRRKPDHEAVEVAVRADSITDPDYFPKSKTDGANRIVAKGDVEIDIRKQHPGSKDKDIRPEPGTTLKAKGKDSKVTIEGRRINKINRGGKRASTTVSGMVEIFKSLRSGRSHRCLWLRTILHRAASPMQSSRFQGRIPHPVRIITIYPPLTSGTSVCRTAIPPISLQDAA